MKNADGNMVNNNEKLLALNDVCETIKEFILNGKYKPGEKLIEGELARQLGISRTPIREAIRRLESEGLIKTERLKGAYVAKLSIDEVKEIYYVRGILESHAAELAVINIGQMEIRSLIHYKEMFNIYKKRKEYDTWLSTNIEFHQFLAKHSRNSTMLRLLTDLGGRVHRYQFIATTNDKNIELYSEEHEKIIESVLKKDAKMARFHMEKHLKSVQRIVTEFLDRFPTI
jgi:DNA-binding GntR family transcriptional regulator